LRHDRWHEEIDFENRATIMKLCVVFAALFIAAIPSNAVPTTLWSIYWWSAWTSCGDGVLLLSDPPQSLAEGTPVSIAQRAYSDGTPWGKQENIAVIGYGLIHEVTNQTSGTWLQIGSGHGDEGGDVFGRTAGVGNIAAQAFFPPGIGIPRGPVGSPNRAHFDVYGTCLHGYGQQRALVSVFYTSP
jgi:hypothetical protein